MGEERESESESEVCRRGGGVVMDTPERTQIANPISKFEDSPVFNYINSLSPIKPVKSVHVTQTFNSLSFASLPSVFTSPHVSSLKESRFLKRHQFSDPAKPELSSENEKKAVSISKGIQDVARSSSEQEAFDLASSVAETSVGPPYERSKLDIELSRKLHYNCVSPGAQTVREMAGLSVSIVPVIQEDSGKGPFGSQVDIEGVNTVDHNKEVAGCDWESLISDAPDLLIFDSPSDVDPYKGSGQESLDPTKFSTKLTIDVPKTKVLDGEGSIQQHQEENLSENNGNLAEAAENQESLASSLNDCMLGGAMENVNDELGSNLHRGMRRRCLVFEMVGSRRKHLHDGLNSRPPMLSQSNEAIASNSNILVPVKIPNDSSRCILPGIGLHLNALATSSMDHKIVKHEGSASGGQLIIATPSTASYQSAQESPNMLPGGVSLERDIATAQNEAPVVEDASQEPGCMVNEELNHSSPKKKRRRLEQGGESEACKRCNCKKSKCLKLYCECFAAGVYCVEPCSCHDCFNKPIHEETVLSTRKQIESRNPLAFAPKVIRTSDPVLEIGDESSKTPASARHKRGCNCKKSGCLKKYCECYQGGVGCSINCRCEGCKNGFGRKDGSLVGPEDLEDEDVDESERSVVDKGLEKSVIQSEAEQNSATPATPSLLGRQPPQLPASSKSKPPRSFLAIGSTSGSFPKQRFGKLNPFQTQSKLEKHFQTVCEEDEIPEILQGNNSSPVRIGVKSASSPNSKRVSPPHSSSIKATVLSPGKQRSSRKLILQSIPSFPSLTPKH